MRYMLAAHLAAATHWRQIGFSPTVSASTAQHRRRQRPVLLPGTLLTVVEAACSRMHSKRPTYVPARRLRTRWTTGWSTPVDHVPPHNLCLDKCPWAICSPTHALNLASSRHRFHRQTHISPALQARVARPCRAASAIPQRRLRSSAPLPGARACAALAR